MGTKNSPYFVAYDKLGQAPNIVVDGSGNAATAITLSHWPKSGTPQALKADTSTEIVFNYLAAPQFHVTAAKVSNNHFDEDGLAGIYALIEPEAATAMRDLVVGVAHAGDFATYWDRRAAQVAFTISAFADLQQSPLDKAIFELPYAEQGAALYQALLPRLGEMLTHTDRFRRYWEREDQVLTESERALRQGDVTIQERAEVDLAIVRIAERRVPQKVHRFTWAGEETCHPMAIHNTTRCNRILVQQGRRYAFTYRYESWVQFMSRPPPPRVDLAPLAEALSADESGAARWTFDGVSDLTPRMILSGDQESSIPPETFADRVAQFLTTAPPAWDPYDPR
jgi:hypothetical protein